MILKFIKDFLVYGLASILGKIVAVFLMPIYTSILTKEEYGAMALILSCSGVLDLISNLNIHSGIARDYYERDTNKVSLVSTGFFSILMISTFVFILMLVTTDIWTEYVLGIPQYKTAFILMLASVPVTSFHNYFSILTRFKRKPWLYTVGILIQITVQVSISIYGVVFLRGGIVWVFWGALIGQCCDTLYNMYINKELLSFVYENKYIKRALKFSIPTLPAIIAGWLDTSFGQIIIGRYISIEELGVYSIAVSISSAFILISTALQNVWSPFLYENYQKEYFQEEVNRLYKFFVLCLAALSITLSLFSKEIVLLLSNETYLKASEYIVMLCIPMAFYVILPFASSGVSISRDTKFIGISYVSGTIANLILLFLFVGWAGVIMVPICLGISRIINYMILAKATERKKLLVLPNKYMLYYVVLILLCYLVVSSHLCIYIRALCFVAIDASLFYLNRNDIVLAYNSILKKRN